MSEEIVVLCGTAATIGVLHTLLGPDHYLPFLAMARAGRWSAQKTVVITVLCGVGHVLSSVVLGLIGIAFGVAVLKLDNVEAVRGDIAGWALVAFGLVYMVWGIRRAIRNRPHAHLHLHADGSGHEHTHVHDDEHGHAHEAVQSAPSMTPWVLFTIFVFGPCEPLIPILMYPAARGNMWGVVLVASIFSLCTIGTMTAIVVAAYRAIDFIPLRQLERYSHATAGFVILACGLAVTAGL